MIVFTGAVVVLVTMMAGAQIGNSTEPRSFYTETEEYLLYYPICSGNEYEVRYYKPSVWVSTKVQSYFTNFAVTKGILKLYAYMTGDNEAGVNIDITAPFIVKVNDTSCLWKPCVYVISFLIPSAFQTNAPKPLDSTVSLQDSEMHGVDIVKSYSGQMVSVVSKAQASHLKKLLNSVLASYNNEYHYNVAYDSPIKFKNRHNEVWYLVQGMPVCEHE
ncbi:heme-binding protein 2 [Brachyhypopomus gauderio]|uniref:heme-binding protein 2 n=1 Tax=Brachyhypopomus gauderio TaxID=698409 RepID=UPI0040432D67